MKGRCGVMFPGEHTTWWLNGHYIYIDTHSTSAYMKCFTATLSLHFAAKELGNISRHLQNGKMIPVGLVQIIILFDPCYWSLAGVVATRVLAAAVSALVFVTSKQEGNDQLHGPVK
jgi:hypothetical protein